MAIIREIVTANGVTVRIADDCCAGISETEKLRRRQALRRVLDRIAANMPDLETRTEDGEDDLV